MLKKIKYLKAIYDWMETELHMSGDRRDYCAKKCDCLKGKQEMTFVEDYRNYNFIAPYIWLYGRHTL